MTRRFDKQGFTLIELVVVVLILGIIAAVAAPKMFNTTNDARMNATRQSLVVLRDAIELHREKNGSYPTTAAIKTALQPFLKGPFPSVLVGANQNSNVVASSQNPITTAEAGGAGWAYNQTTGDIVVNEGAYITW